MIKDPVTLPKNVTVKECVGVLFRLRIGAVIIIDESRRIEGIFTERDLIRTIAQNLPLDAPLADVMSTNVVTISSGSVFGEAKELMRLYRIRRIPVVDADCKLVGLISLRRIIDEFFELIPRTRIS
jgi:CBS domain-containing protein